MFAGLLPLPTRTRCRPGVRAGCVALTQFVWILPRCWHDSTLLGVESLHQFRGGSKAPYEHLARWPSTFGARYRREEPLPKPSVRAGRHDILPEMVDQPHAFVVPGAVGPAEGNLVLRRGAIVLA